MDIDIDKRDEDEDRSLLGDPEAQLKATESEIVQNIHKQDAAAK